MTIEFEPSLVQMLNMLVAVVLPILVGLVTNRLTSGSKKAILLAVLALVTGLATEALAAAEAGATWDLAAGLYSGVSTFLYAVVAHFGFWKPVGVSDAVQAVGAKPARPDGSYDASSLPK